MEFDIAAKATAVAKGMPFEVTVDGRFLYGAPASDLELGGDVKVQPAAGRPGFAGYAFGGADGDEEKASVDQMLEDLPHTDAGGKAKFDVTIDKLPETTRPLEAQVTLHMAEAGGRAIERKLTLPVTPGSPMIGVKPLFAGASLGEAADAAFDVVAGCAGRQDARAPRPALRAAAGRHTLSVVPAGRQLELRADQADQARRRRHRRCRRRSSPAAFRCR